MPPTPVLLRGNPILERLPPHAAVAVEVGVLSGRLSEYLLSKHKTLHLLMVDNWEASENQPEHYKATGDGSAFSKASAMALSRKRAGEKTWRFRKRRTIIPRASVEAARYVKDASCDLVFIDADHSEEAVASDLAAWERKVKPGGYLGGHDFGNPANGKDFSGVKRAVERWANGREIERGTDWTWFCRL